MSDSIGELFRAIDARIASYSGYRRNYVGYEEFLALKNSGAEIFGTSDGMAVVYLRGRVFLHSPVG